MASAQEIRQRMMERQATREAAFEPLAEILEKRQELQRQVAALDEPYGKAFAEAEAGGWTTEELIAIGAEEPVKRPKGRPRAKRGTGKKAAPETAPTDTSTASPAAAVPAQEGAGEAAAATAGSLSV